AKTVSVIPKPLFVEGFLDNPYPIYRRFLNEGPIHYIDYARRGVWAVFRYAECSTIVRDTRLSAKRAGTLLLSLPPEQREQFTPLRRMHACWILFIHPPAHSRLRKLLNKGFSPAVVESLRPQVESVVDRMLLSLRDASEVDLLKELAYPLPVRVIAEMLGISHAMHDRIIEWTDAVAVILGTPNRT